MIFGCPAAGWVLTLGTMAGLSVLSPAVAQGDGATMAAPYMLGTDGDDPVLGALRQRRLALDVREEELELRALELKAVERRIEERITVLGRMAAEVKQSLARQEAAERSRFRGLARSYEAMRPAEAASLLDRLEPELRVAIARYMREAKLGPVLARMAPENARQMTIGIAEIRTAPGQGS